MEFPPVGALVRVKNNGFVEDIVTQGGVYEVTGEMIEQLVPTRDGEELAWFVTVRTDLGEDWALNYDRIFQPYDPDKPVYRLREDYRREEILVTFAAIQKIFEKLREGSLEPLEFGDLTDEEMRLIGHYVQKSWKD